ncbi:MAG: hypothetical protein EON54_02780 [Alcaligenaceae bacterium]|nr:MAG: hypothetical protein EON54_02780 [Alcaligenaceae bacterium]
MAFLFSLGQVVATPGALQLLRTANLPAFSFLRRHSVGDWGDLDAADAATNTDAVKAGARILSAYTVGSERLWVITEAVDDHGKRSSTCLLLPEEY